jgi:enterochelin esterase-like enzyme
MTLRHLALTLGLLITLIAIAACDPLAPEPTASVIIVTPTDTPQPSLIVQPTVTPSATLTPTPRPSHTPSRTLTPSRTVPPSRTPTPTRTNTPAPTVTLTPSITLTPLACAETEGQIVDLTLTSAIVRGPVRYRVYLPPCYSFTGKRYPFVILMHGSDRDQTQWTDYLEAHRRLENGIALGVLPPMILIMPYGGALANSNAEFGYRPSWEDVVISELLPDVERNFCTWNLRESRAIGGISRGGFWAFVIGFRHPSLFSTIGGHSAFFDLEHIARQVAPQYNPLFLAQNAEFRPNETPRIWLDVGADDYARRMVEEFRDRLLARNIDPGFVLNPEGEHTLDYWKAHTAEYLSFYGRFWPRNSSELPSCLS